MIGKIEVKAVTMTKTTPMTHFPALPKLTLETCPDLPETVVNCFLPEVDTWLRMRIPNPIIIMITEIMEAPAGLLTLRSMYLVARVVNS